MGFRFHLDCKNQEDMPHLLDELSLCDLNECWNACLSISSMFCFSAFLGIDDNCISPCCKIHEIDELLECVKYYILNKQQFPQLESQHKNKEWVFDQNYKIYILEQNEYKEDVLIAEKLRKWLELGVKYNCYITYM
jgi:hypothetical protein